MASGSGPGAQAPDGCSVELYRQSPYLDDLAPVREFLPAGAPILELGCGTGRLTRVLLDWRLRPTAVDESAAMLAELPGGAERVLSAIEALALDRRFDRVLLASRLINHADAAVRAAFAACAARYLQPGGKLLLQRHDPVWLATAQPGLLGQLGPASLRLESVARNGPRAAMHLRYDIGADSWHRRFETESLSESQIEALLRSFGFSTIDWHAPARTWAVATLGPQRGPS